MKSFTNFADMKSLPRASALVGSSPIAIIVGIIIRVHVALGLIVIGEKYSYTELRGVA